MNPIKGGFPWKSTNVPARTFTMKRKATLITELLPEQNGKMFPTTGYAPSAVWGKASSPSCERGVPAGIITKTAEGMFPPAVLR